MTDEKKAEKKIQPINKGQFQLQEAGYRMYDVVVPEGVSMKEALRPEYWTHVSQNIVFAHDEMRLRAENGEWLAYVYVVSAHSGFLTLEVVSKHELMEKTVQHIPTSREGFTIKWIVGNRSYSIIRDSDSKILVEGLTKPEAEKQRKEYIKSLKQAA